MNHERGNDTMNTTSSHRADEALTSAAAFVRSRVSDVLAMLVRGATLDAVARRMAHTTEGVVAR